MAHSSLTALVATAMMLTGCSEVALKRGAGPESLASDRTVCQQQNANPAAIDSCLHTRGWHVVSAPDVQAAKQPAPTTTTQIIAPASHPIPPQPAWVSVHSWINYHGAGAGLADTAKKCAADLGGPAPPPGLHWVSRALYECLGAKGWHAI